MSHRAKKDVFLCHATEDKHAVVHPLARFLQEAGITYWLDEAQIEWGDSITRKVNEGLKSSRYAVVVLTSNFLGKHWPQRELDALISLEASTGQNRILPLLVGSDEDIRKIKEGYPLLADKFYLVWRDNPAEIAKRLQELLNKEGPSTESVPDHDFSPSVPMPRVRKIFTDRERHKFRDNAFESIREYFKHGLAELERYDKQIETDFKNLGDTGYVCRVYVNGELKNQCRVLLGGGFNSEQITYAEGRDIRFTSDGQINDWLAVEVDDEGLYLMSGGFGHFPSKGRMSIDEGAEYLWRRFVVAVSR